LELKDIKLIIDLMKKNDLSLFELEKEGFKIRLKKGSGAPEGFTVSTTPAPAPVLHSTSAAPLTATAVPETPAPKGKEITSPLVGTFYAAMSPDSPPYVKVGQVVTEDTVVCIIEAMKVMNEIKALVAGTVIEVLGENGKAVQYGQPLFRVQ
jgi:acetyl-CoA carboxylase biotin carboxyl carrier protein